MKRYLFLLLFTFAVTVPVFAQAGQSGAVTSKIVIVDTAAFFNEKSGITRILTAANSLSNELAPKRTELQQVIARVQQVEKEVAIFRENVAKGIPIDEKAAQAKVEELERLKREGKYKEDEFNTLAQKRQTQVVGPEYSAALKALGDYVKLKGFGLVFDASKDQNGMLLFATEQYDITKEFVTYYNTRPPTAINSVPK